jgi:hypothetical protein
MNKILFFATILIMIPSIAISASISGMVLNYPNPFNPCIEETEIIYELSDSDDVAILIYNILGQVVWKKDIHRGEEGGRKAVNRVVWEGRSMFDQILPNDIYFCRILNNGKDIGGCKIIIIN